MANEVSFHLWASEHPTTVNARLRPFPISLRPLVLDAMRLAYEAGWVGAVDQPPQNGKVQHPSLVKSDG